MGNCCFDPISLTSKISSNYVSIHHDDHIKNANGASLIGQLLTNEDGFTYQVSEQVPTEDYVIIDVPWENDGSIKTRMMTASDIFYRYNYYSYDTGPMYQHVHVNNCESLSKINPVIKEQAAANEKKKNVVITKIDHQLKRVFLEFVDSKDSNSTLILDFDELLDLEEIYTSDYSAAEKSQQVIRRVGETCDLQLPVNGIPTWFPARIIRVRCAVMQLIYSKGIHLHKDKEIDSEIWLPINFINLLPLHTKTYTPPPPPPIPPPSAEEEKEENKK